MEDSLSPLARPQFASDIVAGLLGREENRLRTLDLVVRIRPTNVDVRGLRDYLTFLDRTYGRLAHAGLPSYAQRRRGRLRLAEVRAGSWEAVMAASTDHGPAAASLIVLGLALKYLPNLITAAGGAYRDFEEARLVRERRRQLRAEIDAADREKVLTEYRRDQVVKMVDELIAIKPREALRAAKFSRRHVEEVTLEKSNRPPIYDEIEDNPSDRP